jgi:hypothetical protein
LKFLPVGVVPALDRNHPNDIVKNFENDTVISNSEAVRATVSGSANPSGSGWAAKAFEEDFIIGPSIKQELDRSH